MINADLGEVGRIVRGDTCVGVSVLPWNGRTALETTLFRCLLGVCHFLTILAFIYDFSWLSFLMNRLIGTYDINHLVIILFVIKISSLLARRIIVVIQFTISECNSVKVARSFLIRHLT